MWKDLTKKRFYWAEIQEDFDEFLKELSSTEVEEEADLFRLRMHERSQADLSVFSAAEKKEILSLLGRLIRDTRHHGRELRHIVAALKRFRRSFDDL